MGKNYQVLPRRYSTPKIPKKNLRPGKYTTSKFSSPLPTPNLKG